LVVAMAACAEFEPSAKQVAVILKVHAVLPATSMPFAEIVLPVTLRTNAVFEKPLTLTVAQNCWDPLRLVQAATEAR
jgi:hypothetical protein